MNREQPRTGGPARPPGSHSVAPGCASPTLHVRVLRWRRGRRRGRHEEQGQQDQDGRQKEDHDEQPVHLQGRPPFPRAISKGQPCGSPYHAGDRH